MTLDSEGMIEVLQSLKAPLMIPMHYFSVYTLAPLSQPRARAEMGGRDRRRALDRHLEGDFADDAEGAGAARVLSKPVRAPKNPI